MLITDAIHIHFDVETFSCTDLTKCGVYKYVDDPTTDVLLASYKITRRGKVLARGRWHPGDPYPFAKYHDRLGQDVFVLAWNSNFERIIWWNALAEKHGWPHAPLEGFICVAAWARSTASAPSKLELAAQFFGQKSQKNMKGHTLMLQMCKPATDRQQLNFLIENGIEYSFKGASQANEDAKRCHHTPEKLRQLHDYCDDDVDAETDIAEILPVWEWPEIEAFWESERINDAGICVDIDFAETAATYAEQEKAELAEELIHITGDPKMTPRTFQRFKDWALPRISDEAIELTEWYDKGVKKNSFDADVRGNLLAAADADPDFLPYDVYEALHILDEAGKSTIAKYENIARRATDRHNDGRMRVHGLYMFAGAAQSGRYSSVGIQAHNLVRDVPKQADSLISSFVHGNRRDIRQRVCQWADEKNDNAPEGTRKTPSSPIHALGTLVRPTLIGDPDDTFDLVWGDWSSVEAIALPWLANDPGADKVLEVFRRGEDLYIRTAAAILNKKPENVTKDERQAYGKVPVLSLGYGGGEGAFMAMARNYGVYLEPITVRLIVKDWRAVNAWAPRFWKKLESAAMLALDRPGVGYSAGRVQYVYEPDALDGLGALFCELPSGRRICYPEPDIEIQRKSWGEVAVITARKGAWRPKKGAKAWPRVGVWKGLLAENITQACCADLLNSAILRVRDGLAKGQYKFKLVAHTHDELLIESRCPERDAPLLKQLMQTRPGWQGDDALPLKADVEYGYRYKVPFADEMKLAA